MVRIGRGHPMGLHVRRSDRGELVRGEDHVRGVGGGLLGMEVGGHVREDLGGDPLRREVVGHGARMGQPHCLHMESRWAGLELRALGPVVGREGHGDHELRVFHHGAGRAGTATVPKGCRLIRLFRSRGCHRRQGD